MQLDRSVSEGQVNKGTPPFWSTIIGKKISKRSKKATLRLVRFILNVFLYCANLYNKRKMKLTYIIMYIVQLAETLVDEQKSTVRIRYSPL